jgi:hypothetical protein
MRGHILEVEFLTLDPKTFGNLLYFFTKYKDLLSQLKACGVDKSEEKQMVLTILSKIGPEYSVFVSTFHLVRLASGDTWKMSSLEAFIKSLTQKQTKLINMGKMRGSRHMHLLCKMVEVTKIRNLNTKIKGRDMQIQTRKGTQNPSTIPPDPKVEREEKGRNERIVNEDSIQNLHACRNR